MMYVVRPSSWPFYRRFTLTVMPISPIRKSNIVISIACSTLFLMFESTDSTLDYFYSAQLFFNAWLSVLLILLSIMITSLIPTIHFSSDNWHKPSNTISPFSFFKEPVNFIHYVAITAILTALMGASLTGILTGNFVYPLHIFAAGSGTVVGLTTAPALFKGSFTSKP